MRKAAIYSAVVAAVAGIAGTASAATIPFLFNPAGTGAGGALGYTRIDQAPGSALGVNGNLAVTNCFIASGGSTGAGTCQDFIGAAKPAALGGGVWTANDFKTQLLYQANLARIDDTRVGGNPSFAQGTGGYNFTFAASFGEIVQTVNPAGPGAATATFIFDAAAATNFFRMYATGATQGNDLTGDGFGQTGTSVKILEGTLYTSTSSSTANASCVATSTCPNLDGNLGNNWGSTKTVTNNGSTSLFADISFFLAGYFPDLSLFTDLEVFANTSQVVPFLEADPSCAMIDQTTGAEKGYALGAYAAATETCTANARIGSINGANPYAANAGGPDFLFQADANSSISGLQRAPEPGSLALLAGGLMAAGFWGRRRSLSR